jgi:WhiB family redox-sensing transcriptional regulator
MALPLDQIPFNRPDWEQYGLCRYVGTRAFFPSDENRGNVQARARQICHTCPVEQHCLARAMYNREEGIWGGTSTQDRQRLRKNRSRAKCPVCLSQDVARLTDVQPIEVCMGCGHSWKADSWPVAQHRGRQLDDHAAGEDLAA